MTATSRSTSTTSFYAVRFISTRRRRLCALRYQTRPEPSTGGFPPWAAADPSLVIAATSWVDAVGGLAAMINIAAVLVGGAWAYFKFAKGRTFAYRIELSLDASLLKAEDVRALEVTVTLRNTGAASVPLSEALKLVRVYGARLSEWLPDATVDWGDPLAVVPVLEHHAWIEAQEVIADEILVPVPAGAKEWLAYRCECMVVTARRRGGGELRWSAYAVVPAALADEDEEEEER